MDPDYQNALTQGLLGNANAGSSVSPQALVQGLLGSFNGGGSYHDPQSWTPEMIKAQQSYGNDMLKPMTVHRPAEGAAELVRSLLGGNAIYQANQTQQGVIAGAGHDYAEAQREGQNAGVGGGAGTDASAAGGASADVSPGFNGSFNRTLGFEGGWNAHDTNGTPTNYGINQAANPDIDVSKLTPQTAKALYKQRYWDSINGDSLSPAMARVGFDTSVVAGPAKANDLIAQSGGDPNKLLALRQEFQNGLLKSDPGKYGPYAQAWASRNQALASDVSAMTSGGASASPANGGAPPGGFTHPLAQGLANYRPGIDPELAGRIASSPWSSAEAKAYVQALLNPPIRLDGSGNQYLTPPTGRAYPYPGMGPGVVHGGYDAAGVHVPTATTSTPGEHPTFSTQVLAPGGQPGAPSGGQAGAPSGGAPNAPNAPRSPSLLPPEVGTLADQGAQIGAHADAIKQVGAASGGQYAQDRAAAGNYAQRVFSLRQAIPALEKLGPSGTGPGTTQFNEIKSFVQSLGLPGVDASKIQSFDEAKKYLTDYVRQSGGTGTNDQLAAAFAGNPSVDISNAAAVDVTKSALALQRMQQAKVLSADASRPEAYADHARDFSNQQDVRAYGIDLMSPEARAKLNASMAPGSPERARFLSSLAMAKKTGVLQPPGGQ